MKERLITDVTQSNIQISIAVRTHNDSAYIGETLRMLFLQKCSYPFEVIVCNDNSTDETSSIISKFPNVRLMARPEGKYIPGKTVNELVKFSKGNIIVFNNADAIPLNENYIENLTLPLIKKIDDSNKLVATYGNQLPRDNASYLVQKDSFRAFGTGEISKHWGLFFSLASSAFRKDILLENFFDEEIQYSEDIDWAYKSKKRGESIKYIPEAKVCHSHNYTLKELKKRFYNEGLADGKIYGKEPDFLHTIISYILEVARDVKFLLPRPKGWIEIFGSPVRRFIQKFYHFKGARDYLKGCE